MSETEEPAGVRPPSPPAPTGGPPPGTAPGAAPHAFNVQLPPIDVEALSKTPWVVGAAAILIGLVLYWAGSIISAFQHNAGYDARQRIIHLLGPGDAEWAVIVLLAIALLVLGSSGAARAALTNFLYQLLLVAAALITVASVINAVIDLTYIGSSFDVSIYGFLEYLAGAPIAGAAVLWAWRANPIALPGQKPKAS
jgi:hypothetical protein